MHYPHLHSIWTGTKHVALNKRTAMTAALLLLWLQAKNPEQQPSPTFSSAEVPAAILPSSGVQSEQGDEQSTLIPDPIENTVQVEEVVMYPGFSEDSDDTGSTPKAGMQEDGTKKVASTDLPKVAYPSSSDQGGQVVKVNIRQTLEDEQPSGTHEHLIENRQATVIVGDKRYNFSVGENIGLYGKEFILHDEAAHEISLRENAIRSIGGYVGNGYSQQQLSDLVELLKAYKYLQYAKQEREFDEVPYTALQSLILQEVVIGFWYERGRIVELWVVRDDGLAALPVAMRNRIEKVWRSTDTSKGNLKIMFPNARIKHT